MAANPQGWWNTLLFGVQSEFFVWRSVTALLSGLLSYTALEMDIFVVILCVLVHFGYSVIARNIACMWESEYENMSGLQHIDSV